MRLIRAFIVTAFVASACARVSGSRNDTPGAREFFTFDYPESWIERTSPSRQPTATGRYIASSPVRLEGVGIGSGQADIIVRKVEGADLANSVAAMEALAMPNEEIVSSQNLPARPGEEPDCSNPTQVVSRDEMGPGAIMINTHVICRVDGVRFLVVLRYWESEPRAREFRDVALSAARSIRFIPSE